MRELFMELMEDLNELSLENPENPHITSQDWAFSVQTDGSFHTLELHGVQLLDSDTNLGQSKRELLEEIRHELVSWVRALQSTNWAVARAMGLV